MIDRFPYSDWREDLPELSRFREIIVNFKNWLHRWTFSNYLNYVKFKKWNNKKLNRFEQWIWWNKYYKRIKGGDRR